MATNNMYQERIQQNQKFLLRLLNLHIGHYYPLRKWLGISYKGKIDEITHLSFAYNTKYFKKGKKWFKQVTRTYQQPDLGYKLCQVLDKIPQLAFIPALLQPAYRLGALAFFFLTQTTYQPTTKDTHVYQTQPGTSYGSNDKNACNFYSSVAKGNAFLHFDISDIANGATFTQGDVVLYVCAYYGGTFYLNRMTRTNWTEAATWNKYDGTNAWTTAGGDFTTTNRTSHSCPSRGDWTTFASETWSSAQLIQDCYDNQSKNVHLAMTAEEKNARDLAFYSRENTDTTNRPKLTVTYTVTVPANFFPFF